MTTVIPSADGKLAFVQVGVTALRDEAGQFLPATPLFVAVERDDLNPSIDQAPGEEELIGSIADVLAEKFAGYVAGIRQLERIRKEECEA